MKPGVDGSPYIMTQEPSRPLPNYMTFFRQVSTEDLRHTTYPISGHPPAHPQAP